MDHSLKNTEACVLLTELAKMKELIFQLEARLSHSSRIDSCNDLTSQMCFSIEKSINIAKSFNSRVSGFESPFSACGSPKSENSERVFKYQDGREVSKKRKTLPKLRKQVMVTLECGVVGPTQDGHSWRKYGQKDILGAKYPRGYYRCTHRNTQGCFATKKVQRTNENPMVFEVTYDGIHTCHQKSTKPDFSNSTLKNERGLIQEFDQNPIQPFQTELKFEMEEGFNNSSFTQFSLSPSHSYGRFGETCEVDVCGDFNELISMSDMDFNLEEFEPNFFHEA